jgi:hypothetical protein
LTDGECAGTLLERTFVGAGRVESVENQLPWFATYSQKANPGWLEEEVLEVRFSPLSSLHLTLSPF